MLQQHKARVRISQCFRRVRTQPFCASRRAQPAPVGVAPSTQPLPSCEAKDGREVQLRVGEEVRSRHDRSQLVAHVFACFLLSLGPETCRLCEACERHETWSRRECAAALRMAWGPLGARWGYCFAPIQFPYKSSSQINSVSYPASSTSSLSS